MWNILLISGDPDVDRQLLVFREQGGGFYKVDRTDDFAHAVTIAAARQYDAYIIDGTKQTLAGNSLCSLVRSWDEDGIIVFLSNENEDETNALNAGADIFLLKPRDMYKITLVIDDLLDQERGALLTAKL